MGMPKKSSAFLLFSLFSLLLSTQAFAKKIAAIDGEAIAFLMAANKQEVEVAKDVEKKAHNVDVKSFAEYMIKEHSKNLDETYKVSKDENINPLDTDKIKALKKNGAKEKAHLDTLSGMDLDKAYINAMVDGHKEVLAALVIYGKKVSNKKLKNQIKATIKHVKHHLAKAKEIQAKLK